MPGTSSDAHARKLVIHVQSLVPTLDKQVDGNLVLICRQTYLRGVFKLTGRKKVLVVYKLRVGISDVLDCILKN